MATSIKTTDSSCRHGIRWPHKFKMDDIFGMWFAVEVAQHTPDLTDKQDRQGCLMLHVVDVADEPEDRIASSAPLVQENAVKNLKYHEPYNRRRRRDARPKRSKEVSERRRLLLFWDEEGRTLEQIYLYSVERPELWAAQQRNDELLYPYENTRREETIYVLNATTSSLVLHHCTGDGRPLTLMFRRLPVPLRRWERAQFKNLLKSQQLPHVYRESTVCSSCRFSSTTLLILLSCLKLLLCQLRNKLYNVTATLYAIN